MPVPELRRVRRRSKADGCRTGASEGRQGKSEPTSVAYVRQVRQATETVALAQPYRLKSAVAVYYQPDEIGGGFHTAKASDSRRLAYQPRGFPRVFI